MQSVGRVIYLIKYLFIELLSLIKLPVHIPIFLLKLHLKINLHIFLLNSKTLLETPS